LGDCLLWEVYEKYGRNLTILGDCLLWEVNEKYGRNLTKNGLGCVMGDFSQTHLVTLGMGPIHLSVAVSANVFYACKNVSNLFFNDVQFLFQNAEIAKSFSV
jgi:hypothetical protein